MKQGKYSHQLKIFREVLTSKLQGQHPAKFNFCRYEGLCTATKISPPCLSSTEFCKTLEQLLSRVIWWLLVRRKEIKGRAHSDPRGFRFSLFHDSCSYVKK